MPQQLTTYLRAIGEKREAEGLRARRYVPSPLGSRSGASQDNEPRARSHPSGLILVISSHVLGVPPPPHPPGKPADALHDSGSQCSVSNGNFGATWDEIINMFSE